MSTSDEPSKSKNALSPTTQESDQPLEGGTSLEVQQEEEILETLSGVLVEGKEEEARSRIRLISRSLRYSGPIPPATEIEAWGRVLPGSPDRILAMSERSLDSSSKYNELLLTKDYGLKSRGQLLALVALFGMLAVAVYCFSQKMETAGITVSVLTIISVVAMFLGQRALIKKDGAEINIGLPLDED